MSPGMVAHSPASRRIIRTSSWIGAIIIVGILVIHIVEIGDRTCGIVKALTQIARAVRAVSVPSARIVGGDLDS